MSSSRIGIGGSLATVRAIAILYFYPPNGLLAKPLKIAYYLSSKESSHSAILVILPKAAIYLKVALG